MRIIDADLLKLSDFQDFSNTDVMTAIDSAPTVDVPAPVKCGECIFRCDYTDGHCECRRWPNVPMSYQRIDPNFDFCSYGKRKDDNHEFD